jgi:hypothetical protein
MFCRLSIKDVLMHLFSSAATGKVGCKQAEGFGKFWYILPIPPLLDKLGN